MKYNPYLEFLSYCLNDTQELPDSVKNIDWKTMMTWAERQSIVGIIFAGIQKADKALKIPFDVLMEWIGSANLIENRNKLLNSRCVEVVDYFKEKGFESCILKGQGNAAMYSNPMLRMPGDIDLWVMSGERLRFNGSRFNVMEVIRFVKGINPKGRAEYHHIDFGEFKGVEVEAHYRPTFMNNLIKNRRLQRWMIEYADEQFGNQITLTNQDGRIPVPTWEFNVVFQLSPIYRHVIQNGVGFRQIIDYFYLLRSEDKLTILRPEGLSVACNDNGQLTILLRHLGLYKIAGAMMWMLNEVLGLPEEYLIAPKDEKRGRVLLAEIMKGGNFGHYDAENQKANNAIKKNIQRLKRDVRMVRYFPSECLWEPVFRVYHYFWRSIYGSRSMVKGE